MGQYWSLIKIEMAKGNRKKEFERCSVIEWEKHLLKSHVTTIACAEVRKKKSQRNYWRRSVKRQSGRESERDGKREGSNHCSLSWWRRRSAEESPRPSSPPPPSASSSSSIVLHRFNKSILLQLPMLVAMTVHFLSWSESDRRRLSASNSTDHTRRLSYLGFLQMGSARREMGANSSNGLCRLSFQIAPRIESLIYNYTHHNFHYSFIYKGRFVRSKYG